MTKQKRWNGSCSHRSTPLHSTKSPVVLNIIYNQHIWKSGPFCVSQFDNTWNPLVWNQFTFLQSHMRAWTTASGCLRSVALKMLILYFPSPHVHNTGIINIVHVSLHAAALCAHFLFLFLQNSPAAFKLFLWIGHNTGIPFPHDRFVS